MRIYSCRNGVVSVILFQLGALSSVVEHYLHTVGVAGSKPAARTILSACFPIICRQQRNGKRQRETAAGNAFRVCPIKFSVLTRSRSICI
jgi:hypothetical protein